MIQEKGGQGKIIHHVPFEKKPKLAERKPDQYESPTGHNRHNRPSNVFRTSTYDISGYSQEAGGSFEAKNRFISSVNAKLKMSPSHGGDWLDMRVETVSKRHIRMFTNLSSGNSMYWNLSFSKDMDSLNGYVVFNGSSSSNFKVSGTRVQ